MERQLWTQVYRLFTQNSIGRRRARQRFSDAVVAGVYLWAVVHDRPVCWACRPCNWPADLCRFALPSASTVCRRLAGIDASLDALVRQLRQRIPTSNLKWIDSKPMTLPGRTTDPQAARGRVPNGFANGYRLHAVVDASTRLIERWVVLPLNRNDRIAADELLDALAGPARIIGDSQYDVDALYVRASRRRIDWLARPRTGGWPQDMARRSSPERRRAIDFVLSGDGRSLLSQRRGIESVFARLVNTPGLLGPLPTWVRRLHRVRLWVAAKLLFDTVRQMKKLHLRC